MDEKYIENHSFNKINDNEKNQGKKYFIKEFDTSVIDSVSLSSKSKVILIIRVLIYSLICIFFPLQSVIGKKLEMLENKFLFPKINKSLENKFYGKKTFKKVTYYTFELLAGKDSIIIYISIVYFLFHPFIALKLVFVTDLIYYGIVILQILIQSYRPLWQIKSDVIFCNTNFGNPCIHYFFISFFFLYLLISYRLVDKKKKINIFVKILIYIIYLIVLFIQAVTYLINHTHYLYQLIFTLCISLILLCIMIDLDIIIHNFIFKSLKNIYKSRKYKMKIFFYVLGMSLSAVLMLFFIEDLNLNEIKRNLNDSGNCINFDIENFGTMKSFLDIDYIFYIIGSFWGASFTIEYNIEKWWDDKFINSFIKILVSILLNILLILINKLFTSLAYEILFLIQCFSYFIRGYLIFGILPYIFQASKKNKGIDENDLFETSIFCSENIPKNYNVINYNEKIINEEKKMNKEEEKNKKNKSNLYSSLVANVKKHTSDDGLEFTLKDNKQEISPQSVNIPLFKEDDDLNN